jgi:ERCC4-type nuclease
MMFDLQLMGILIWDCPVLGEAARDIATIIHSLHKEEHKWVRERERPNVLALSSQYRNNIWSLCAFDGIGPKLASLLLAGRSFADVIRAAEVAPLTLTDVEGFGKKRAEKLNEEVTVIYG